MRSHLWEPATWPTEGTYAVSFAPYFAEDPEDEAEVAALDAKSRESMAMVQAAIDGSATEISTRSDAD
jgi:hypothetical protein